MISVLSPVHPISAPFLAETFQSLLDQTYTDWQWVLCENHEGKVPEFNDPRITVFSAPGDDGIGKLKRLCACMASGDILVELDADDLLTPDALQKIADAFSDPNVAMVYSNSAQFQNGTWEGGEFSNYWGWTSRDFEWQGHALKEQVAWEPSAHMMRQVFWAPDHVRAWRTSTYWEVGGHDPELRVGDDHDLCCRYYIKYGAPGIKHIDECLYLYRLHGQNTCYVFNDAVQQVTLNNYLKYSRSMAARWARDNGVRLLDLGGRFGAWEGFETVDLLDASIITDLNERWPFEDNSVGVINASHIFEHLKDPIHTMNEAYRVLAPGGWLFVEVPSTDGRGAFQDPTHVSFWNENSFWYYTNAEYAKYISPAYQGRFQSSRVVTYFPNDYMREHDIPIVQADLIALKSPYSERHVGEVLI
jgi:O-antigen biosynthesis protein